MPTNSARGQRVANSSRSWPLPQPTSRTRSAVRGGRSVLNHWRRKGASGMNGNQRAPTALRTLREHARLGLTVPRCAHSASSVTAALYGLDPPDILDKANDDSLQSPQLWRTEPPITQHALRRTSSWRDRGDDGFVVCPRCGITFVQIHEPGTLHHQGQRPNAATAIWPVNLPTREPLARPHMSLCRRSNRYGADRADTETPRACQRNSCEGKGTSRRIGGVWCGVEISARPRIGPGAGSNHRRCECPAGGASRAAGSQRPARRRRPRRGRS